MVATTLPTPLYALYQQQFGFSELMVTVIFGTYVFGVIAALLAFGRSSDRIGCRPVLLGGRLLAVLGTAAFLVAQGVGSCLAYRRALPGRALCRSLDRDRDSHAHRPRRVEAN